jgi:hypothetical protein
MGVPDPPQPHIARVSVLAHARALLAGDTTIAAEGDRRYPATILENPGVRGRSIRS